jgi:hypothetical protein
MAGLDGDALVFERAKVSKELLCDLHVFLHHWMPTYPPLDKKAFLVVRSGLFVRAVTLLEESRDKKAGLEAARSWIRSVDLATRDVRSLQGVGPIYEVEWNELRNTSAFRALPKA